MCMSMSHINGFLWYVQESSDIGPGTTGHIHLFGGVGGADGNNSDITRSKVFESYIFKSEALRSQTSTVPSLRGVKHYILA